jgi:DNA-binding transcriptional LysR family regulator
MSSSSTDFLPNNARLFRCDGLKESTVKVSFWGVYRTPYGVESRGNYQRVSLRVAVDANEAGPAAAMRGVRPERRVDLEAADDLDPRYFTVAIPAGNMRFSTVIIPQIGIMALDRLDELAIFVAIIETGSLIAASRRLRKSPPAVTRALGSLEERMGARLVERTTRRLAPTEAGTALVDRARALLARYDAVLVGEAHAPVRGVLRVTAPVQFGRRHVAPIVSAFLNQYPDTRVELSLNDRNLDFIEEGLDLAVRMGSLADSSLEVVASPSYLAEHGQPRTPADLAGHDTIFGLARSSAREWRFGPSPNGAVVRLAPRLLVDDVEAQLQAAQAGRGIARPLSYQVADELSSGTLVRLL